MTTMTYHRTVYLYILSSMSPLLNRARGLSYTSLLSTVFLSTRQWVSTRFAVDVGKKWGSWEELILCICLCIDVGKSCRISAQLVQNSTDKPFVFFFLFEVAITQSGDGLT